MSIYAQIGGASAIETAVEQFYERVINDDRLAPYFDNTDFRTLKAHQRRFIGAALGGPEEYTGRDMASAHAGLNITGEDFELVLGHLASTLKDLGVDDETVATIATKLGRLKGDIATA